MYNRGSYGDRHESSFRQVEVEQLFKHLRAALLLHLKTTKPEGSVDNFHTKNSKQTAHNC